MRTPGERICYDLRRVAGAASLVHLHPGPRESAQSMADILLIHPVSSRRLLNAVDRLLLKQDDDVIFCGPFAINRSRRILLAHGQETQLTPKQALLVELFFSNPGATLDRRTLMERVWQTDYMGDTRTLDVHIRWVREMLEADPSHPIYLRTVRGVGYRLELNVNGLAKST
ncbi:MAG: response regulator transcription factor [Anaerolineae bacterium]|nr:response regulator transcription factor [Anaerolineae bacterium]MBN8617775.1 response regulator transcription factor [Anaerolineae bacterium]